jgi:hypothetical protein
MYENNTQKTVRLELWKSKIMEAKFEKIQNIFKLIKKELKLKR